MAFQGGRRTRKGESIEDLVNNPFDQFELAVGVFTHKQENGDFDKLYTAVYYHRVKTGKITPCVDKAGIEKEPTDEDGLLALVKVINSSGDDIIQDVYPLLMVKEPKPYCFRKIVLNLCTKPKSMKDVNTKGVDHFEYAHASEFPVEEDHLQLLQKISVFDDEKILYPTTKVKFLDSIWPINSNDCSSDLLGLYLKIKNAEREMVPQVWLFMNNIFEANERYCDDHHITGAGRKNALKYIIAYVYIHEMMHRYFDIRPDLNLKRHIPQIEEPMAEYATLKFCKSFGDDLLFDIAVDMVNEKRNGCFNYYALGYDLYKREKDHPNDHPDLIEKYRRVSMIIHKNNEPYINDADSIVDLINNYDADLQKASK